MSDVYGLLSESLVVRFTIILSFRPEGEIFVIKLIYMLKISRFSRNDRHLLFLMKRYTSPYNRMFYYRAASI